MKKQDDTTWPLESCFLSEPWVPAFFTSKPNTDILISYSFVLDATWFSFHVLWTLHHQPVDFMAVKTVCTPATLL